MNTPIPRMTDEQRNLVESAMPTIRRAASKLTRRYQGAVEYDDALALGVIGAIRAVHRYDPSTGCKFSTYAYKRVHGEIMDWVRSDSKLRHSRKTKLRAIRHARTTDWQSVASPDYMSGSHGSYAEVHAIMRDDHAQSAVDDRDAFEAVIARITTVEVERQILRYRFVYGYQLEEIGSLVGYSGSRVSQKIKQLLAQGRGALTPDGETATAAA